jgi:capsular polysaccharide biosynthesis protein
MKSTDYRSENHIELSLLGLLTILALQRRFIAICMLVFIALGVFYVYAVKVPSYTATATIITDKDIATDILLSLAQSTAVKQPLSEALQKQDFITDADITNDLDGVYTITMNPKGGLLQLSLRLKDAAAAQLHANTTAQRIVDMARNMQLSEVGQKLGKLTAAKADITKDLAKLGPVPLSQAEKSVLMPYVLPIAALESSTIVQGGEPQLVQKMQGQLVQKMQEDFVHVLQASKVPDTAHQQQYNQFIHLYKTLVLQSLDREIVALLPQEQSQIIAIPASLPKKPNKPGRTLLMVLFIIAGTIIAIVSAFVRYAIQKHKNTPEWEQLRRALRS